MIVYVAAPYSNVADKEQLMKDIAKFCGQYMLDNPGEYTITGLVHHYAVNQVDGLGTDWNFWKDFCEMFLKRCDKLAVLRIPGWDWSRGVQTEIEIAHANNIPVFYFDVE